MPANYMWSAGDWSVDPDNPVKVITWNKTVCVCEGDTFEEACANAQRIVEAVKAFRGRKE